MGMLAVLVVEARPTAAQSLPDGFLRAEKPCEATPRIRSKANPGRVRLEPGTTYRLLGENKAGGTHYRIVAPGASPERRWIGQDCGEPVAAASASPSAPAPGSAPSAPAAPPPAAGGERPAAAGRRGGGLPRAIVALNWQPAFCEASGRPECTTQAAGRFDASNFALHGLWPQPRGREFCGVSSALRQADEAGDWNRLPAPALSASTRRDLDEAMPGTRSGLDRHEWLRHGTCYGTDADEYFRDSLLVLRAVNASAVRKLFADGVGRTLTLGEVRAAFDRSFGARTGERVRLTCRRDGGRQLISEITLGLAGTIGPQSDIAALIRAAPAARGGCEAGVVDAVGRQ